MFMLRWRTEFLSSLTKLIVPLPYTSLIGRYELAPELEGRDFNRLSTAVGETFALKKRSGVGLGLWLGSGLGVQS